ncbi:hypothetical protein ACFSJY_06520 [Thalassotalea euphylliae]|uniref:hypothetical protein n=1 Tax=Thalassotalea euphylliae TaxID=1655234 RepID=UPI00363831B8
MSKALELLEKLGNGTSVSDNEIKQAQLSEDVTLALLNKDKHALEAALNVRAQVFCGIHEPDEDDDKKKKISLAING